MFNRSKQLIKVDHKVNGQSHNNNVLFGKISRVNNNSISNYHESKAVLALSTSKWDNITPDKLLNNIFNNGIILNKNFNNKELKIAELIKYSKEVENKKLLAEYVFFELFETYKMALKHDCFHDVISKNENGTLTIAFLPITTSENPIYCGIQKFGKIHINSNIKGYKTIYISRVLYHKTMSVEDYNKWVLESKF